MAEFQKVMREWKRMCKSRGNIPDDFADAESALLFAFDRPDEIERLVMEWAAEHPEPVYPSIAKYLEQFGITIRRDGSLEADFFKANEPMSADTAKLLGISSEEGGNEKTD